MQINGFTLKYTVTHLLFPLRALQLVSSPCKLTPPFPQIFSHSVGAQGFLQSQPPPLSCRFISLKHIPVCLIFVVFEALDVISSPAAPAPTVASVPVLTSLQSSPALGSWLSELQRGVSAFDIRRVAPSFLSQGPEMADYEEALEQLRLLSRCYRDDSDGVMRSSSEEDDDD